MQLITRKNHVDSELHLEHVGAGRSCEEGQAVSGDDLLLPAGPIFSFLVQSNTTGAAFDCRSVLAGVIHSSVIQLIISIKLAMKRIFTV